MFQAYLSNVAKTRIPCVASWSVAVCIRLLSFRFHSLATSLKPLNNHNAKKFTFTKRNRENDHRYHRNNTIKFCVIFIITPTAAGDSCRDSRAVAVTQRESASSIPRVPRSLAALALSVLQQVYYRLELR